MIAICRFVLMTGVYALSVAYTCGQAQNFSAEQLEVKQCIDTFFKAMYENDGENVKQLFHEKARLYTVVEGYGSPVLEQFDVSAFITAVSQPKDERWKEVLWNYQIDVDGLMASVWTDYTFFLVTDSTRQLIHCGINSFELFKDNSGWRITQITDTRHTEGCRTE